TKLNQRTSGMKCVIIEDEQMVAGHLESLLSECRQPIEVVAKLDSVKSAVAWLSQNQPDLLFMDIQLGDDLVFSIFDNLKINAPVIFTTSYDEYAIKAFRFNGIAYLLKPIDREELQLTLDKVEHWYHPSTGGIEPLARTANPYQKRFLVQSGKDRKSVVYGKELGVEAR